MRETEAFSLMLKGVAHLEEQTQRAASISAKNMGVEHTGRQNRALFLFSKIIVHNMSLMSIIQSFLNQKRPEQLLDHFSVAALGRTSIDACLMTMYLSQPDLTADQWNLRRKLLFLHDLTSRKRFLTSSLEFSPAQDIPFFQNYAEMKKKYQQEISIFAKRCGYLERKTDEFKKGQLVFIEGSRGAVREAGWNVDEYDYHQVYLSSFVHSHPVSWINMVKHDLSFSNPSAFQLGFTGYVAEAVSNYTGSVVDRIASFCDTIDSDPNGHID